MVRSEKTRQYIIEKTASVFNKQGYTGTYLSDLTNATGLTKGSIYGNFKDKNEVAVAVFNYNYHQLTNAIHQKINQIQRADEKLLCFLNHYLEAYPQIFENGGCAILNTAVDADDGNEQLKTAVSKALYQWMDTIINIVNEGIENREIKPITATTYTHKFIATIEGSIMMAKTLGDPQILKNNIHALKEEIQALTMK